MHGFPHLNETSSFAILWVVGAPRFSNGFGDTFWLQGKSILNTGKGGVGRHTRYFHPVMGAVL